MAHHHYDVADNPDEHGIQQVWKRHRQTLRFFRLICKRTHYRMSMRRFTRLTNARGNRTPAA